MYSKLQLLSGTTYKSRIWQVICNNCKSVKSISESNLSKSSCNCKYINSIINNIQIINYKDNFFICKCFCNKIFNSSNILSGKQKSCGCLNDLTNKKYENLLYLNKENNKWKCLCNCGNIKYLNSNSFGKVQSCGCIQKTKAKENLKLALNKIKIFSNIEAAQRIRWKNNYKEMDFNLYLLLSSKKCFYCNQAPNQKYLNNFRNGIDKVNNSLPHILFNSVPCCSTCNKMKRKRSLNEFYSWINSFNPKSNLIINESNINNNIIYKIFKEYSDTDLNINEFAYLISQPCHYCNLLHSNTWNNFNYNGLDRLNNNLTHLKSNIVPCCKHCNYAKRNLNINDFYSHLNRLKLFNNL